MKHFSQAVLLLGILATQSLYANAKGDYDIGSIKVKGLRVGLKMVADQAFASKHQIKNLHTPFEYFIPKRQHIFVENHPAVSSFIKYSFANDKKELLSNVQFTNMSIPLAKAADRVAKAKALLTKTMLPQLGKDAKIHAVYETTLGQTTAVCLDGDVADGKGGRLLVKAVAYIHPTKAEGVMGVSNLNPKLSAAKNPQDLRTQGLGTQVLYSFRYL